MFVLDEGGDQTKLNRRVEHDGRTRREMLRLAEFHIRYERLGSGPQSD